MPSRVEAESIAYQKLRKIIEGRERNRKAGAKFIVNQIERVIVLKIEK